MDTVTEIGWKIAITLMTLSPIIVGIVLFFMAKSRDAIFKRQEIRNAILEYQEFCNLLNTKPMVSLSDMEKFNKTVIRFWDFGNKRILPKEKYNVIKPFIRLVTSITID